MKNEIKNSIRLIAATAFIFSLSVNAGENERFSNDNGSISILNPTVSMGTKSYPIVIDSADQHCKNLGFSRVETFLSINRSTQEGSLVEAATLTTNGTTINSYKVPVTIISELVCRKANEKIGFIADPKVSFTGITFLADQIKIDHPKLENHWMDKWAVQVVGTKICSLLGLTYLNYGAYGYKSRDNYWFRGSENNLFTQKSRGNLVHTLYCGYKDKRNPFLLNPFPNLTHIKKETLPDGSVSFHHPRIRVGGSLKPITIASTSAIACLTYGMLPAEERYQAQVSPDQFSQLEDGSAQQAVHIRNDLSLNFLDMKTQHVFSVLTCKPTEQSQIATPTFNGRFNMMNLEEGFMKVSEQVYGARQKMLASLAEYLPQFAPAGQVSTGRGADIELARLWLLNALAPFFDSIDAEWIKKEVTPQYKSDLSEHNRRFEVASLRDIYPYPSVRKAALTLIVAGTDAMRPVVTNPAQKEILTNLKTAAGVAISKGAKDDETRTFVTAFDSARKTLNELSTTGNPQGQQIALLVLAAVEYLDSTL